jgi:hypothetical protein
MGAFIILLAFSIYNKKRSPEEQKENDHLNKLELEQPDNFEYRCILKKYGRTFKACGGCLHLLIRQLNVPEVTAL